MTRIGVISDTHGLLRPEALEKLRGSDLILHAGDMGSETIIPALRDLAPVHAVRGNVDRGAWAYSFPLTEALEIEQVSLYMYHGHLPLEIDPTAGGFDIVVSGHSHQPSIEKRESVLYLNPGSAGRKRFSLPVTLARLIVKGDKGEAELISLET